MLRSSGVHKTIFMRDLSRSPKDTPGVSAVEAHRAAKAPRPEDSSVKIMYDVLDPGFYAASARHGMDHSPTSATGTAWEPTPWHATQRAAWEALSKVEERNR